MGMIYLQTHQLTCCTEARSCFFVETSHGRVYTSPLSMIQIISITCVRLEVKMLDWAQYTENSHHCFSETSVSTAATYVYRHLCNFLLKTYYAIWNRISMKSSTFCSYSTERKWAFLCVFLFLSQSLFHNKLHCVLDALQFFQLLYSIHFFVSAFSAYPLAITLAVYIWDLISIVAL